ncbi:transcription initiation factor TFIID subunit 11 [Phlyctochytrium bullatum]|nr:transcription initiation factor TFIID subunit 11 [Phlyctochytrium bullatum]
MVDIPLARSSESAKRQALLKSLETELNVLLARHGLQRLETDSGEPAGVHIYAVDGRRVGMVLDQVRSAVSLAREFPELCDTASLLRAEANEADAIKGPIKIMFDSKKGQTREKLIKLKTFQTVRSVCKSAPAMGFAISPAMEPLSKPARGRGSRGPRGRGRGSTAAAAAATGGAHDASEGSSRGRGGGPHDAPVTAGRGRPRGRGRGAGRGRGTGSMSIVSQSVLVTIPEPFAPLPNTVAALPQGGPTTPAEDLQVPVEGEGEDALADDPTLALEPYEGDKGAKAAEEGERDPEDDLLEELENDIVIVPKSAEEQAMMNALIQSFSAEKMDRFEKFRRSKLSKGVIKKLLQPIFGSAISPSIVTTVAGCGKLFIGDIVERALQVKEEWEDGHALSPEHVREAFRRYKNEQNVKVKLR